MEQLLAQLRTLLADNVAILLADRQTASQKFCWMLRASIEVED